MANTIEKNATIETVTDKVNTKAEANTETVTDKVKFEMIDFDKCKNMTETKNLVRSSALQLLYDAFVEIVGIDNVSKVVTDEKGTKEIAVALGTKTNSDGFNVEVCFTVKATAKEWEERKTLTGKRVEMFDRLFAEREYKRIEADKIEKTKKAKEEKEKKAKERQAEKNRKKAEKIKTETAKTETDKQ